MNTSMTINAPAAWLLALYIATAEKQGVDKKKLSGTTQNDITKRRILIKRNVYISSKPSLKLSMTSFTTQPWKFQNGT